MNSFKFTPNKLNSKVSILYSKLYSIVYRLYSKLYPKLHSIVYRLYSWAVYAAKYAAYLVMFLYFELHKFVKRYPIYAACIGVVILLTIAARLWSGDLIRIITAPRPLPLTTAPRSSGFQYMATDNKTHFAAYIGSNSSNAPQVKATFAGGSSATFVLTDLNRSISKPSKSGNKLVFKDVRNQVDLAYQTLTNGVKEDIIVKQPQQGNAFTFALSTQGAKPKQIAPSTFAPVFYDKNGNYVFHFAKPFAVDAKGARTDNVVLSIHQGASNTAYLATIIVNQKWLSDPARAYPVTIDPTVVYSTSSQFSAGQFNRVTDTTPTNNTATGGTITYSGGYTIHTFTSSGTFTPTTSGNVDYLVVGGGGGGGSSSGASAGGGGGGGFLTGSTAVTASTPYTVTVGGGGNAGTSGGNGTKGGDSVFGNVTATGGGYGGAGGTTGGNGGSGGGGGTNTAPGGSGIAGQGYAGGTAQVNGNYYAGGGGGAGSVGAGSGSLGNGGSGLASSLSGSSVNYAGGGGGGSYTGGPASGTFGGGNGGYSGSVNGVAGTTNTGGGGGGSQIGSGGNGGSGIVIIRYPTTNAPNLTTYYQELAADQSTVGLWHMNEATGTTTVADSSGNNNTGISQSSTDVTTGIVGNARSFNGSSDYISVPDSQAFNFGAGNFTIEYWEYRTSSTNAQTVLQRQNTGPGYTPYLIGYQNSGVEYLYMTSNDSSWDIASAISMGTTDLNKWNHFAVVRSGTQFSTYKNGVLQTNFTSTLALYAPSAALEIGRYAGGNFFQGSLDEMRISNVARTPEEIRLDAQRRPYSIYTSDVIDLAGATTGWNMLSWTELGVGTGDGETVANSSGLVAQWNFNETSNTTASNSIAAGAGTTSTGGTITYANGYAIHTFTSATPTNTGTGGTITYSGGNTIHTFTSGGTFTPLVAGNVEVLVVGGGGGGGGAGAGAGGGGGGGVIHNSSYAVTTSPITVTVGGGGAGVTTSTYTTTINNGSDSIFGTLDAVGGGGGSSGNIAGGNGGSGGGGCGGYITNGGTATSGQGYAGGKAFTTDGANYAGGGGGGAGAVGVSPVVQTAGGNGGIGVSYSISGSSSYYGGGGGGGTYAASGATAGTGGSGGGGNAGNGVSANGTNGTANTGGGGGGGGGYSATSTGGNGGSGIVIVSYPTTYPSSTFTPSFSGNVQVLVVGGGGGGSTVRGGGGGAGGLIYNASYAVTSGQPITISVGSGGNGWPLGVSGSPTNGANSVFGTLTAVGGGRGAGGVGGSGGGGNGATGNTGGSGTSGQGSGGGSGVNYGAGGGGGAGGVGVDGTASVAGNGGAGLSYSISGSATFYAGGGGGGHQTNLSGTRGTGGSGGGGTGGLDGTTVATNGTANTGGGGGGGGGDGTNYFKGGDGGSGVVIVSYPFAGTSGCGSPCNGTLTNFASTGSQDAAAGTGWTATNARWPKASPAALMFSSAASNYVNLGTNSALDVTTPISIEAWVKTSNTAAAFSTIISNYAASKGYIFALYSGTLAFWDGTDSTWKYGLKSVGDGTWHYVVVTHVSGSTSFYVDGNLDSTVSQGDPVANAGGVRYIGQYGSAQFFNGVIDSTRIYSRALTASEILSNYNATNTEFQTRVGNSTDPNDGTWENGGAWVPATTEVQLDSMDTADKTAKIDYSQSADSLITKKPTTAVSAGSGADGVCTVTGTTNINTASCAGRGTPDGALFSSTALTSVGATSITLSSTPTGLAANDEVLIINEQGTNTNNKAVGQYETHIISSISTNTLNFTDYAIKNTYDGTTQKITVQRVPNYTNVTIGQTASGATGADSSHAGYSCLDIKNSGINTNGEVPSNTTGLLAQWNFNETSGATATNSGPAAGNPTTSTGGTITYAGGYAIHTFTGNGTFTPAFTGNVDYLVVAGGGGGGGNGGGGGGAGGYQAGTLAVTSQSYAITVGSGGAGRAVTCGADSCGANGGDSVFSTVTATGGGGGADGGVAPARNGIAGGSGGGSASYNNSFTGGAGTSGQGYKGSNTTSGAATFCGGGGGGAGGAAPDISCGTTSGGAVGGAGVASSITGTSVTRASGGSGYLQATATPGGGGAYNVVGTDNTGGGGGANVAGGSGIVIIRYPFTAPTGGCGASCNGTLQGFSNTTGQDVVTDGWTGKNKMWGAGALSFNGSSDYVDAGNSGSLSTSGLTGLTLEAWIEPTAWGSYPGIIGKGDADSTTLGSYLFYFVGASQQLAFLDYSGGARVDNVVATGVQLGQWNHVVVTWQASTAVKIYINGVLQASKTSGVAASIDNPAYNLLIGSNQGGTNKAKYPFQGSIDSTRVYNRALTAAEINTNYINGTYWINPAGTPVQAQCDMTRDGGGWTLGLKEWYQSGAAGTTGALGAIADAGTVKGNPYKLSDANIRAMIGSSENFDVLADQTGYNTSYSTGNYEYNIIRNYTGYWRFDVGMPGSTTETQFQSYRASDNALASTFNMSCGEDGAAGINCSGISFLVNNPAGGAGCNISMGSSTNAGWHHFAMSWYNTDTYLYLCNGAQYSSGMTFAHRFWFRERQPASLTANAWDGTKGGIVAFRANGTVTVNNGAISTTGLGYRGGSASGALWSSVRAYSGEAFGGPSTQCSSCATTLTSANGGAGGSILANGAPGGSYGSQGTLGISSYTPYNIYGGALGYMSGDAAFTDRMLLGGGGGGGGDGYNGSVWGQSNAVNGLGGNGGGITFIGANALTVNSPGRIDANGIGGLAGWQNTAVSWISGGSGGGGAGGSVNISGNTLTLSNNQVAALGGQSESPYYGAYGAANGSYTTNPIGGVGGVGRIALLYNTSLSGNSVPSASVNKPQAQSKIEGTSSLQLQTGSQQSGGVVGLWHFGQSTPTKTFVSTGADQTYMVPAGVNSISVKLWGAGGGAGRIANDYGGGGGYTTGTIAVSPGQTLKIVAGGGGQMMTPGSITGGGSGGGYSGIFNSSVSQANALLIAGGGGGGGYYGPASIGGPGGGTTGGDGCYNTDPYYGGRGRGGTQSAGGIGGTYSSWTGQSGSALQGGAGVDYPSTSTYGSGGGATYGGGGAAGGGANYASGGGGGGYYGGGGGSNGAPECGGGGSGYIGGIGVTGATTTTAKDWIPANNTDLDNGSAGLGALSPNTNGASGKVIITASTPPSTSDELDASGNDNNAQVGNTTLVNGITGLGRKFGATDYITHSLNNWNPQAATIEMWVKPNWSWNDSSIHGLWQNYNNATVDKANFVSLFKYANNQLYFRVVNPSGVDQDCAPAATGYFTAGQWTHVAAAYNSSGMFLYINGVLVCSTGAITVPTLPVDSVGRIGFGYTTSFGSGIIDEVRISSVARSAEEVAEDYRLGANWYVNKTLSTTDLSAAQKLTFTIAGDRPGTYVSATIGNSAFANYQTDANTVGLWHLEEKSGSGAFIKDSSDNGNHGSIAGGAPTFVQGKIGNARSFNGSSDYISTPNYTVATTTTPITFDAWIQRTGTCNNYNVIVSHDPTSGGGGPTFMCGTTTGHINELSVYAGGAYQYSGYIIGTGWTYVALTYDGSIFKMYANGLLVYTSGAATVNAGTIGFTIGGRWGTYNNYYFPGSIDEVRVSNIARSAADIRAAYEAGLRTHQVTIDFAAKLNSGNLINDVTDKSFTIDGTGYGFSQMGSNLYLGDKIVVREYNNGTTYIAQGTVNGIVPATGATTVISWDTGSTFPTGGFTTNADVFKWQTEYWDISSIPNAQRNAVNNISLRLTNGNEGRTIWLDNLRSTGIYMSNPAGTAISSTTGDRYFQYRIIQSSGDYNVSSSVTSATINYTTNNPPAPTMGTPAALSTSSIQWNFTPADTTGYGTPDGFLIYDTSNNLKATCVGGSLTSCTETGLSAGTQYTRKVVAYNSTGHSRDSNTVTGSTLALPQPTMGTPAALSTSSIQWNFTPGSTSGKGTPDGFLIYDTSNNLKATCAGSNITSCIETGLSINTQYTRKVVAYDSAGHSIDSAATATAYTLAAIPNTPVTDTATATSIHITITAGSNPSNTQFAVYFQQGAACTGAGGAYFAANGNNNGNTAVWQTAATWGTIATAGFDFNASEWVFCVKARNGDNIETGWAGDSSVGGWLPQSGNFTITEPIAIQNKYVDGNNSGRMVSGLDHGSGATNDSVLTIAKGGSFTVTTLDTFVAGSFVFPNGSTGFIALPHNSTAGQLKPAIPLWVKDADADGFIARAASNGPALLYYGAKPTGGIRQNAANMTRLDCDDTTNTVRGVKMTGGTITNTTDGYKIHTFSTSGTLTLVCPNSYSVQYFLVAGGGSGGGNPGGNTPGGGGGGGVLTGGPDVLSNTAYTVTVGTGGPASGGQGNNGQNSVFNGHAAIGGGGGGGASYNAANGNSGGSGGGGNSSSASGVGGSGTSGQGYGGYGGAGNRGGGGGGAGAAAVLAQAGNGIASSFTGSSVTYGGGGSGGIGYDGNNWYYQNAGSGGGGAGGVGGNGGAGTDGLGGGGGGASSCCTTGFTGGKGGNGVAIVRYLDVGLWFRDADSDGYGDPNVFSTAYAQPTGYVANNLDCYDSNANAYTGSTYCGTTNRGDGNFDYSCDGVASYCGNAMNYSGSGPALGGFNGCSGAKGANCDNHASGTNYSSTTQSACGQSGYYCSNAISNWTGCIQYDGGCQLSGGSTVCNGVVAGTQACN